jgi:16S rRNA processing protein RimM
LKLVRFGYFSRTVGLKGELVLKEEGGKVKDDIEAIFVETAAGHAPYFVKSVRFNRDAVVFSLEDIDTLEQAKKLNGKAVYADEKFIVANVQHFLIGYKLIDAQAGEVGFITEVDESGPQTLLHIKSGEKDVMLPLVDDFVEKIDKKKKTIYFKAPEGLIQMYLAD